jgi:hypothetical protein
MNTRRSILRREKRLEQPTIVERLLPPIGVASDSVLKLYPGLRKRFFKLGIFLSSHVIGGHFYDAF